MGSCIMVYSDVVSYTPPIRGGAGYFYSHMFMKHTAPSVDHACGEADATSDFDNFNKTYDGNTVTGHSISTASCTSLGYGDNITGPYEYELVGSKDVTLWVQ